MGNNLSTSQQMPLRCILDNWKLFDPLILRRSCLKFFCATAWTRYPLGDKEHWPEDGSLNYNTILQLVPSSDSNWNYNDPEHIWERDHFLICVKAGLKAAQQKVISYARVSAITQEPNESPIAFLERLKEALQKFTNLDLDSYEGQVILKDKFLSQCASDIRIKLQQLQQQDPAASLDEMVQTATNTFYNREQEREAKAQEREKGKTQGKTRCWTPSREALWQTPIP